MGPLPRSSRGFTLAELLVALALMALLVTAAAMGIYAAQISHAYNSEKTDLVARARGVLDRITRDIRQAESVESPDAATVAITFASGATHTYEWDGAAGGGITLTITDGGTTVNTLTEDVQSFQVDDTAKPTYVIKIALSGEKATVEASLSATPRKEFF